MLELRLEHLRRTSSSRIEHFEDGGENSPDRRETSRSARQVGCLFEVEYLVECFKLDQNISERSRHNVTATREHPILQYGAFNCYLCDYIHGRNALKLSFIPSFIHSFIHSYPMP